ncbi:hypothetical protein [Pseudosulfitobacter koreensis]|uniref:Acyl-CoA dehydrogenase n=1 Tax=Pseudosulfitobacter koreensis TaxID=2968472 RepID=A0ABT1Z0M5_9RHOB|nr:hypothetical protein [Pseudosulfitobacter koreense]MCR8826689.1 hypothetical protein [Pseudosulfitobacter koreense]
MIEPNCTPDSPAFCDLLGALAQQAPQQHRSGAGLGRSVVAMRSAGMLEDSGVVDPAQTARRLMRIGGANLSAARLYEGHVNALRIVEMHGTKEQCAQLADAVKAGAFLGVWGADGTDPLRVDGTHLQGAKVYASGLGTVTHAIVSISGDAAPRIALVQVQDAARQSPGDWRMSGMRATCSGGYDFSGISLAEVEWVGPPGCYFSEPGFVSGVWRIAALQLGATLGLLDAAARHLRARDRMEAEAQLIRLTPPLMRALGAEGLVIRAARFAEGREIHEHKDRGVALSASARLLTEEIAQAAIVAVEQSVGLVHFDDQSETGRIAADLSVYLRQAARDALLLRVGQHAFNADASVWEMLQ